MLGRVVAAQFDLEKAIAALSGKFLAVPAAALDQLHALGALQRQVGAASPADLASLRAAIADAVSATQAAIQDSRAALSDAIAADGLGISGSAAAARQQVLATMAAMDRFDLRFASPEDEADYRKRQDERRTYIDAQLAKGTPEGNLNASAGALGQMVDASAHGAVDSPEFQQRWNALVTTTERLRDEVRRAGGSTAEFDTRLREDLRRILKAKGLSDAQIDAQFAAHPDPLDAAKAFVSAQEVQAIETQSANLANSAWSRTQVQVVAASAPLEAGGSLSDAVSELKALGIVATEQDPASDPQHGVAVASGAVRQRGV